MFNSGKMPLVSLQGIGKTKMFPVSSSVAFLSNFILSISLIPKYQMIDALIGYSSITVVSFFIMYYYAKKFKILKFELAKIAEIYASGFVMSFVIVTLQGMFFYSPLKLFWYMVPGICHIIWNDKVLRTFSKEDLDVIMLLIPWWLQKARVVISTMFL